MVVSLELIRLKKLQSIKYKIQAKHKKTLTQNHLKETVNAHEVEHHFNMKDYWWNSNGPLNALHSFNPLRYFNESIEEHALSNTESYDAIVTSEVLEHVSNKYGFLTKYVDFLKNKNRPDDRRKYVVVGTSIPTSQIIAFDNVRSLFVLILNRVYLFKLLQNKYAWRIFVCNNPKQKDLFMVERYSVKINI
eukprot:XP_016658912.1 PREDICTED: uncharacterized protein LOC100572858 [Acyrthosiphon pisum]